SIGDQFTMYLPPQQNDNFKQNLAGQFEGIGAELATDNNIISVIAPIAGSPAEKAGVKAKDLILKVDGESTQGWDLPKAVSKIKGPKGTQVTLSVLHKDSKVPVDIKITRDVITLKSVTSWVMKASDAPRVNLPKRSESVGYVRLSQFGDNTNKEWA